MPERSFDVDILATIIRGDYKDFDEVAPEFFDADKEDMQKVGITNLRALACYAMTGEMPGHFLTACLSNNLLEACTRADSENIKYLPEIVRFIYNNLPSCHALGAHRPPHDRLYAWQQAVKERA